MHSPLQSPLQPVMRSPLEFRRRGGGSFDIASTNPSAYYDRTVLATLFQDSAGTTPVTAGSQPIGLGLDQSQGLVLGPELVTNGEFTAGIDGWFAYGLMEGAYEWVSDTQSMRLSKDVGAALQVGQPFSTITGGYYWVSADLLPDTVGTYNGSTTISVYPETPPTSPTYEHYIPSALGAKSISFTVKATSEVTFVTFVCDLNSGPKIIDVGEVSIKALPGNHQLQATAGKLPITAGTPIYADFDPVDDNLVATFPASLGAGCTVCRSLPGTGASITTGVTIGTTYTDNVDAHFLAIYTAAQWAALDAGQIANITALLNAKAGL